MLFQVYFWVAWAIHFKEIGLNIWKRLVNKGEQPRTKEEGLVL
jgi:hypothetical protein